MLSVHTGDGGIAKQISDPLDRWTPRPTQSKAAKSGSMDLWTDRLGGSSAESVSDLAKSSGLIKLTTKKLSASKQMAHRKANAIKLPHKGQIPRTHVVGYKWHTDGGGPHVSSFLYGYRYEFGWLDDASNYFVVFFAKTKSEQPYHFLRLLAWCPYYIKQIISDNAGENLSHQMDEICTNSGILHLTSPEYESERNPRIEHAWYRAHRRSRYMISRCGGWRIFWSFAEAYAVVVQNCSRYGPTGLIPCEQFFCCAVDFLKFIVFGCTVVIRTRTKGVYGKYLDNAQWGFYLGWDPVQWKHIMFGLDTNRLHYGCDFTAYEENFGGMHKYMSGFSVEPLTDADPADPGVAGT